MPLPAACDHIVTHCASGTRLYVGLGFRGVQPQPASEAATLKETTGGEFRIQYKASIRYIDLLQGSYNGNCPPEI